MAERFHPDPDQVVFADTVGKSLLAILPLERLHEAYEESSDVWANMQKLGVFETAISEQQGGSGLGAAEEALIVYELGRRAVAPSVLATIGATHLPGAAKRLPSSAERRVAAGYRRGDHYVCVEDSAASLVLMRTGSGAALFQYPTSSQLIDTQLWSSRLRVAERLGECLAESSPEHALRLRLLDAAILAGLARAALDMAVGYASLREQFGRPIGSFQAVKHHCANMALAARLACDLVSFAAVAVDDRRDDALLQVESAFYVAGSAAIENCGKNIQLHGGMGFSDEAHPHHLLKRARVYVEIAGGLEAALGCIGEQPPKTALTNPQRRG